MNLIYSRSYAAARTFALHHELMPGDWKWISDAGVLRWEPSRGGELFPHLYGPLGSAAVEEVFELPLDPAGKHVLPEGL